jgi:hypothetical protein
MCTTDPLLDPRPREDDPILNGTALRQNIILPTHVLFHSPYSLSSLLLSNAARYRSYDSTKLLSTLDEKISSPRGFFAGGIVGIVRLDLAPPGGDGDLVPDSSLGRGKKKESGFQYRRGGFLTFRYMLNERSARFACGTYLPFSTHPR